MITWSRISRLIFTTAINICLLLSIISCQSDPIDKKIDELIKVDRLRFNVILVTMGADAVTAVTTEKGIVVIDAGISYTLTMKYRKVIEREFNRNDFAYVIHTHAHPDHYGGDGAFPGAVIIGQQNGIKEMTEYLKDPKMVQARLLKISETEDKKLASLAAGSDEWNRIFSTKARYQFAYHDMTEGKIVPKTKLTFKDSLTLPMGDESVNLFYFGKAHSESDIFIHLPAAKLLMTGDLFFSGGTPSMGDFTKLDIQQWRTAMQWAKEKEIDKVIGGHGDIMSKKDLESFNEFIEEKWKEMK